MSHSSDPGDRPTLAAWLTASGEEPELDALASIRLPRLVLREDDEQPPDLVLGDVIGVGGMATVVRAHQVALDRSVAVKRTLHPERPAALTGLVREAVIGGRLQHPNIVPVHLVGETDEGEPVVVMQAVGGVPWDVLAEQEPALEGHLARHLEVFGAVCQAIAYAHQMGVVHRDIKPDNVRIGDFGEVYLLDWGIAVRLGDERPVSPAGTPAFMAPEARHVVSPDVGADIFGLAATLLAVLLRDEPPRDEAGGLLPPSSVPDGLGELLARAGAADPCQRTPDAESLRVAVVRWHEDQGVNALLRAADGQRRALEEAMGLHTIREAFAVARFAYQQVLEARPSHVGAHAELAACFDVMVRAELAEGRVDAARARLASHPAPSGALERELVEAEQAHARRRQEEQRLRAVAQLSDLSTARLELGGVLFGIGAVTVAVVIGSRLLLGSPDELDLSWRLVVLMVPVWLATLLGVSSRWSRLSRSVAGGRLALSSVGLSSVLLAGRLLGALLELDLPDGKPAVLAFEPALLVVWALGLTPLSRRFYVSAAVALAGWVGVLVTLRSDHHVLAYNLFAATAFSSLVWAWWDSQQEAGTGG